MLTCEIRNILAVPETYRAMPRKKKPQRNPRPEIPESLIMRQQQLKEAGITSEIRWDKLSRDYYLAYKNPGLVPAWN
jgi:hypothetical protein